MSVHIRRHPRGRVGRGHSGPARHRETASRTHAAACTSAAFDKWVVTSNRMVQTGNALSSVCRCRKALKSRGAVRVIR